MTRSSQNLCDNSLQKLAERLRLIAPVKMPLDVATRSKSHLPAELRLTSKSLNGLRQCGIASRQHEDAPVCRLKNVANYTVDRQ